MPRPPVGTSDKVIWTCLTVNLDRVFHLKKNECPSFSKLAVGTGGLSLRAVSAAAVSVLSPVMEQDFIGIALSSGGGGSDQAANYLDKTLVARRNHV